VIPSSERIAQANKATRGGQGSAERRELARAAGLLGGLTLVSRVTGLMRDALVGALIGASPAADAFFLAFRIPNLLRRVVAEGASSSAFVPVFTSYREREGDMAALGAARAVGIVSAIVLAIVTVAGCLLSDRFVSLFAPGFGSDPAKRALTVTLTAGLFPYLWFVGMAAWAMGTLHTFRRFAEPAYGPICFNLAIVACALALWPLLRTPIFALVVGVLVGGFLQLAVQLPALWRLGMRAARANAPLRHAAVHRVGSLLVPTVVGGAVYQINIVISTVFASMLPERSISYLWYADRLFEFPLGVVAVAVGTAALPSLAGHASAARYREMAGATSYALRLVWALCIPATVGLWMLAQPIVTVLFERGEFTHADSVMTAATLRAYAVGLMGVASARVLAAAFYALELPRVPVATGLLAMVLNTACAIVLMGPVHAAAGGGAAGLVAALTNRATVADLDQIGLALATSIAITANAILLLAGVRRTLRGFDMPTLGRSALRHGIAAAAMAALLAGWSALIGRVALPASAFVELGGGLVLGAGAYMAAAVLLGSEELKELLTPMLRVGRARPGDAD
jgi:putative peptidoglycan lipid II flippase